MQAVHFLGIPEGDSRWGMAAIYLAVAPKSDAALPGHGRAHRDVREQLCGAVPMHLRNASTRRHEGMGYGALSARAQFEDAVPGMECLPHRSPEGGLDRPIAGAIIAIGDDGFSYARDRSVR